MTATPTLTRPVAPAPPDAAAPTTPAPASGSGLGWVFTAFFGVFGWATGLAKLTDNSFFWHLRTGEYILDHGIPHHDVFSYTAPGTKWIAQSWLVELMYGVLSRSIGDFGIRLAVGLASACVAVTLFRWRSMRRATGCARWR